MEVVAVKGVGVGAEPDGKAPAAGIVHRAKEAADIVVGAAPAVEDRDAASVGELEGRDVDGIGAAMLAQPVAVLAVYRTAGIGSEALDLDHPRSEPGCGRALHRI